MSGDHSNYCFVEIGQNNEKSPGDLRRLDIIQIPVENHQLTLVRKTLKRVNNNNNNNNNNETLKTNGSPKLGQNTRDTEYIDIVGGVLQGDTLAPYLFIICLDYVLRTSIDKIRENGFELTKKRSKRYPAKTITDADYADDLALLANTPNQAETLLHSLERAAAGTGLHVNAHKTE